MSDIMNLSKQINFLAPAPLLEYYNLQVEDIAKIFGLSIKASQYRKEHIYSDSKFISNTTKNALQERFAKTIRRLCFYDYLSV